VTCGRTNSHLQRPWARVAHAPDSPGAEDQRRQEGQQAARGAQFHAVVRAGPPSLAASALPAPRVLSLRGARLCAGWRGPAPAADGSARTDGRPLGEGGAESRSILACDVTGEAGPPGLLGAAVPEPGGALCFALEAARGEGGGPGGGGRPERVSRGCAHPAARPPGLVIDSRSSPGRGRVGAGAGDPVPR
ncbi:Eif-2-Alpha Kinase Gcn2, partial [Manis pentadactyla]